MAAPGGALLPGAGNFTASAAAESQESQASA